MAKAAVGIAPQLAKNLAGARPEAAPGRDLQAVARSALRGQAERRRRPLPRSAGACAGAVRRREEPDPGARPHPAGTADEEGPCRHDDPRLQAPRHDHAVRRAQRARRRGHRSTACRAIAHEEFLRFLNARSTAQTPAGMLELHLIVDNYATHKHRRGASAGSQRIRASTALHADLRVVAQPGRALLRRDHRQTHPPRHLQQRRRAEPAIMDYLDHHNAEPQAVRLDRFRSLHPPKSRPRETSVGIGTLERAFQRHRSTEGVALRVVNTHVPQTVNNSIIVRVLGDGRDAEHLQTSLIAATMASSRGLSAMFFTKLPSIFR